MRVRQVLMIAVACAGVAGCGAADGESDALNQGFRVKRAPVGLSLRFKNGQAAPLQLIGNFPRYLQEIDVTESVTSSSHRAAHRQQLAVRAGLDGHRSGRRALGAESRRNLHP
jgi:hypothetical protein